MDGKEEASWEQWFGEKRRRRWRCRGRVTDAKFKEGEGREVTTRER